MSATFLRLAILALLIGGWLAGDARASVHPLAGNLRFQIGEGLPLPVTFGQPPDGAVVQAPGAVVSQPSGADPRDLVFAGGEFLHAPALFSLPVIGAPLPAQQSSFGVTYPVGVHHLKAGGRTGAGTVTYCAGSSVSASGNPGCASPAAGPTSLKGLMIYTATSHQFGGPMNGRVFGDLPIRLFAGTPFPCAGCKVLLANNGHHTSGMGWAGNAFGVVDSSPAPAPVPGVLTVTVLANGLVTNATPTSMSSPGMANPVISAGGPWTTGRVTVIQTAALGGGETFVLTGFDARVSGVGQISLVAGGLSNRGVNGPNANRGWLNLNIGLPLAGVPSMRAPALSALAACLSLAVGYAMRQSKRN